MLNVKDHIEKGDGMGFGTHDIQAQRIAENTAAALNCSPGAAKAIAALHEKAAAALERAAQAEKEQLQGIATVETLLSLRADALADIPVLQGILQDAEKADERICQLSAKLILASRQNDSVRRADALAGLDALARIKLIAPFMPGLLIERNSAIDNLGKQILAGAEKFKISLEEMHSQFQTRAQNEPSVEKFQSLIAGFAGLI